MAKSERVDSDYRHTAYKAAALTAELHSVGAARLDYHTIRQFSASIVILCEALRSLSHHPGATRPHGSNRNRTYDNMVNGHELYRLSYASLVGCCTHCCDSFYLVL